MSDLPADWAIEKAKANHPCKGLSAKCVKKRPHIYWLILEYARYIEAHEEAPVDRKLLCAREAMARIQEGLRNKKIAKWYREGNDDAALSGYVEALTLYESGFGKDA